MRDAASSTFLTEVASSLKDLHKLCSTDMTTYLQTSGLPPTKLPQHVQVCLEFHSTWTLLTKADTHLGLEVCCSGLLPSVFRNCKDSYGASCFSVFFLHGLMCLQQGVQSNVSASRICHCLCYSCVNFDQKK